MNAFFEENKISLCFCETGGLHRLLTSVTELARYAGFGAEDTDKLSDRLREGNVCTCKGKNSIVFFVGIPNFPFFPAVCLDTARHTFSSVCRKIDREKCDIKVFGGSALRRNPVKDDGFEISNIKKCLGFLSRDGTNTSIEDACGVLQKIAGNLGCELTVSMRDSEVMFSDASNYSADRRILACVSALAILIAGDRAEAVVSGGGVTSVILRFTGDEKTAVALSRADSLMRDSGIPFGWSRNGEAFRVLFCPYRQIVKNDGSVKSELAFSLFAD